MSIDPKRAKEIFLAAVEIPDEAKRTGFLDAACGGDAELRARVEQLLRGHHAAAALPGAPGDDFAPTVGFGDHPTVAASPLEGAVIGGRYKLLERIGDGGMGEVWMAEQREPVKRLVAVKLIKPGLDSRQVLARFDAERQALALMDHPNIARIFDGGLCDGRPFFVMELVKGKSITQFCDERRLSPRDRLALFVPVCQAIQHAHQKGIIHRDIKPNNVLVALYDGRPVPKVIDFGVAKATGAGLTDLTLHTHFGAVVGTPQYMSPEQAETNQLDIDTRSDIYSLGVLLYELLTGSPPFDKEALSKAAILEILRIIREVEPPTPSTRLSSADALPSIAANRGTEPRRLTALVRGELDWIVMKSLEKNRERRYESANAFAGDVQRYLAGEAVLACPPSVLYRTRKFLRRYRGPVVAVSLLVLVLVLGVVGTSLGMVRANDALGKEKAAKEEAQASERKAIEETQIAESQRKFLLWDLLRMVDARHQADGIKAVGGGLEVKENPTIKDLLDRAAVNLSPEKIEQRFPGQKRVQASMLHIVGNAYWGIGDNARAAEFLERARELGRAALGEEDRLTLATMNNLAWVYFEDHRYAPSIEMFRRVCEIRERTEGRDSAETINSLNGLANVLCDSGKIPQAIEMLEDLRRRAETALGPDHATTHITLNNLAETYDDAGNPTRAIALLEDLRDRETKAREADHPSTLITLNNLARAYFNARKLPQAIALFEHVRDARVKQLGAEHPQTLITKNALGMAYKYAGRLPEAIKEYEAVAAARTKRLGPNHRSTITVLNNLAHAFIAAKEPGRAVPLFEQVRDARIKQLGAEDPDTLVALNNLAWAYKGSDRLPQAIELFERVLAAQKRKPGPDHPNTLVTMNNLALCCKDAGRHEQALPLFRAAAEGVAKGGFKHPNARSIINNLINALERAKLSDEADRWRKRLPPEKNS